MKRIVVMKASIHSFLLAVLAFHSLRRKKESKEGKQKRK